jgi:hypothetical protein
MKIRSRIALRFLVAIAAFSIASFAPHAAKSQTIPTNAGTSFQLCFEQNYDTINTPNDSAYCEIDIATLDAASTTITITSRHYPSFLKTFILGPRATQTYRITDSCPNIWIISSERADDRVVSVSATSPIICYGMNSKFETSDDFLALPDSYAGTDYRIMSYTNSDNSSIDPLFYMPSQFAVAAITDSTNVTITPSAPTVNGHPAGAPFTTMLLAGQCIQVQTNADIPGEDLTGSIVQSDKPVVAYGSHARAEVPAGFIDNLGATSRNHLTETMPPTDAWGKVFVLSALDIDNIGNKCPDGDLMRVLALNDGTSVSVNGVPWVTLNQNQFADSLIATAVVVEGSDALLVGEYGHTSPSDGSKDIGDPLFAIIPSVDQTFNDFTFFASTNPAFQLNKVIVAADTTCASNIQLDGNTIPSSAFTPLPVSADGRGFTLAEMSVAPGSHRITTSYPPESAFSILGYGLGDVDTYGSSGGLLLQPVRTLYLQAPLIQNKFENQVVFNNTTHWPVIVDSFQFVTKDTSANIYGIHFSEKPSEVGTLAIAQTATIHLVATTVPTVPVTGKVRIFTHTADWSGIEPAEMNYVFNSVNEGVDGVPLGQIGLSNYPNPFSSFTTISFSLPSEDNVTITLYDGLGHVVRHIASGPFAAGQYNIRLDRRDLPSGFYICEVTSDRLQIRERLPLLAGE